MANRLVLEEVHRASGARMADVWGFALPRDYGDAGAEYQALRGGAGLIDRSPLGKVIVTGRDRLAFLQGMLTNEVKSLAAGQGAAAAFLDAHGKTLALLQVYALEDRAWLELPVNMTEKTMGTLDRYLISEKAYFEAADEQFVILAVQGPESRRILEGLAGVVLDLPRHGHVAARLADTDVRIIERREASTPGLHCWVAPAAAPAVWEALRAAGAVPVGLEALDVARVESGTPWYGQDVDEGHIFPEARLEDLVSYTKGCYIGQEVVARVKYRGHVNRALAGLVLDGDDLPAPGTRVSAEGNDVGWITSAVRSPAVGAVIGLGYVRRAHLTPGDAVSVDTGGGPRRARIAALPFVEPA